MFNVEEVLFHECGTKIPLEPITSSPLVVFISGLDLANTENASLSLDMFQVCPLSLLYIFIFFE